MIAAIHEVYSGEIALWVLSFAVEGLTFADAVDAVVISMDSSGIIDKEDVLDRNQPTMEQIIKVATDKIEPARRTLADSGIPIYYNFGATSADGQRSTEDVEELATFVPDFQEQALYFEAMLQAVSEEPWVTGITIGIVGWFDQFGRPPE